MKKSALWKDTFREITHSKSRFLSIFAIILMGVAFYAGISATGPDMIDTADTYYSKNNLMDNKVLSSMGLTEEDIELLEETPGATVQSHYTQDVILGESGLVLKLVSYAGEDSQQINQYEVSEGRLPKQSGEIALDNVPALRSEYAIGDTIVLETEEVSEDPDENLQTSEFEVVGFVNSPLYVETSTRGNTSIGSGSLDGYGVVPEEDFDMEVKTEAYVVYDETESETSYSDDYVDTIEEKTERLENSVAHRPEERQENLRAEAEEQIEEGEQELEDARQQLAEGEQELANARQELDEGWEAYEEGVAEFEQQTQEAREEIEQQRQQLIEAQEELNQSRAELEAGQQEIADQRANLEERKAQLRAAEEGLEQIQAAEAQLNAAQQEISQQRTELENGRQQLLAAQEGLVQIQEAETQLNAAQEEIDQGRAELEAQRQQLDGLTEEDVQNSLAQIEQGMGRLEDGQEELDRQRAQLEEQREQLLIAQEGLEQLEAAETQLTEFQEEVSQGRAELEEQLAQLPEPLREQLGELSEEDIQQGLDLFEEMIQGLELSQKEIDAQRRLLIEAREALGQLPEAETALEEAQEELTRLSARADELIQATDGLTTEDIQSSFQQLEEAQRLLNQQLEDLESQPEQSDSLTEEEIQQQLTQIEEEIQRLEAAQEALEQLPITESQLEDAQEFFEQQQALVDELNQVVGELTPEEIQQGLALLDEVIELTEGLSPAEIEELRHQLLETVEGLEQLLSAESQIEAAQEELERQREQVDGLTLEEIQAGLSQIEEGEAELAAGQETLDTQRAELENQRQQLLAAQEGFEQIQAADSQLDAAQREVNQGRAELDSQHQQLGGLTLEEVQRNLAQLESGVSQLNAAQRELTNQRAMLESQRQQLGGLDEAAIQEAWAQVEAGESQLAAAEEEIASGLQQLNAAQEQIDSGFQQLEEGEQTLEEETAAAQQELDSALAELEQGEADYEEGLAEFEEQRANAEEEMSQAEEELADAREQMANIPLPDYYVMDRTTNPGYAEFEDNADRISSIAQIFPVFFLLLAALISLTTMTRMVDEGRSHIGTMKALGYANRDIMIKYMVYALLATVLGAGLGLWIGYYLFPSVIFNAFGSLYNLPPIEINHYWTYTIISIIGAILATGGATWLAVRSTLKGNAATLLRPKAPKKGKRILLERIPFIWDRFSFNQKVSARNLFRYKRRMLMTVIGVSGSTALILTGFGLLDSIGDVANLQFGKINQYQSIVAMNPEADDEERASYEELVMGNPDIDDTLLVQQETATAEQSGANSQEVTMFVPENPENLPEFVNLVDYETDEHYDLPDDGVLATQKLMELFDLNVGDDITVTNADNEEITFTVQGIVENYLGHTLYMSPEVYEQATSADPDFNTQLLTFNANSVDEDSLANQLTNEAAVAGITFVTNVESAFQDTLDSLDVVMVVLIVSAAALAFIVLYNLTNINVSERIRELSTIKVLGFYDKEVTMYIYRENLVLTLLGILVGLGLGLFLHQFVIQTAEQDMMMFSRIVNLSSHAYSAILTFVFSGIVMIVMHFKLKNVDMVEALKVAD